MSRWADRAVPVLLAALFAAGAALVALALHGCAEPRRGGHDGVLTVSQEQQASWTRNFNPLLAQGMARWPTVGGIYEPLLVYSTVTGEYVPWLATEHAWSDDGLELVFTVRDGVRWSDGEPFGAGDVVFTFELLARHRALDLHGVWRFLERVEAPDERTVRFVLARRYVPGLHDLAQQPIVPAHVWKDVRDPVSFSNPTPVATGPFTEVEVFANQVYQLGRNPRYWQPGRPAVRSLRFPAYPSNDQANLALISGEVDWAGNFVPAIERVFVRRDPAHHGYWFPLVAGTVVLYPNTTRSPLDDARVRKALSMAIDRRLLVQVAMYDYTRPADATGLSDAYERWRDPEAVAAGDWVRFDPDAAGRLLDEAGYRRGRDGRRRTPAGKVLRLELDTVTGWSDWVRAAQVVARSLDAIGVEVSVKTYDFGAWFDRMQKGTFELSMGWTIEGPTPYRFYRGLMSARTRRPPGEAAPANWHRFADERADELLAAFEVTTSDSERRRLAAELQRLFVERAPVVPLFPNPAWGAYSSARFVGFPTADDPYAALSPNSMPEILLVLTRLEPRGG